MRKSNSFFRDWRTDWFPPLAQQIFDEFHTTHRNIRVYHNLDPENNEYEEKSLADLTADTAPDVFPSCCSYLPIWAQKGYLPDLRKYVQADLDRATIEDWDPAQYNSFFTRDGRQYALPKYHGALAPHYNKDLFDQAHVDYPSDYWTHDDYLAASKRITHDRNKDGKPNLQYDLYYIQASIAVTKPVHFVENDRTGVRVQRGIDELARWCNPPSSV